MGKRIQPSLKTLAWTKGEIIKLPAVAPRSNERKKQSSWAEMVDGLAGLLPDFIRCGDCCSHLADCGAQHGDGRGLFYSLRFGAAQDYHQWRGCIWGLVFLAFLVFWTRLSLAWLFIRSRGLLRWLFSWRMIRRYLYGLAGFALILALFYAEEDWRGKRDWEQYKRAAEAKGERFDLSSFVPPAVPDDQNFLFSPIVSNSCLFRWFGTSTGLKMQAPTSGLVWTSGSMPATTGSPGPPMIFKATGNWGRELI